MVHVSITMCTKVLFFVPDTATTKKGHVSCHISWNVKSNGYFPIVGVGVAMLKLPQILVLVPFPTIVHPQFFKLGKFFEDSHKVRN